MPWIAPTIGYVDNLGNLRCDGCAGPEHQIHPVHGDQHFGGDDVCCRCGHQLEHVPTSRYIQVGYAMKKAAE